MSFYTAITVAVLVTESRPLPLYIPTYGGLSPEGRHLEHGAATKSRQYQAAVWAGFVGGPWWLTGHTPIAAVLSILGFGSWIGALVAVILDHFVLGAVLLVVASVVWLSVMAFIGTQHPQNQRFTQPMATQFFESQNPATMSPLCGKNLWGTAAERRFAEQYRPLINTADDKKAHHDEF